MAIRYSIFAVFITAFLATASGQSTKTPFDGRRFQAHLQAGEFAKAAEMSAKLDQGVDRNHALQKISQAQYADGAKQAAIATAAQIHDDAYRYGTLQGLERLADGDRQGGAAQADFDTLIELITTTVAPETWEDVGGTGSIAGFPGGVLIDAAGLMRPLQVDESRRLPPEDALSSLRKISLPGLEQALTQRQAAGLPPTREMLTLGGMSRIQYVLVYPDEHDIVIAGPAADDEIPNENRLSDLVTALNDVMNGDSKMVCSITPRQANLAATRAFLEESSRSPLRPGQRQQWLDRLKTTMGRQDIEFRSVDANTHTAHVLVAADYHMKLVGMGLMPGVEGIRSYLDMVELNENGNVPPMDVLRWWFTLNNHPVTANAEGNGLPVATIHREGSERKRNAQSTGSENSHR